MSIRRIIVFLIWMPLLASCHIRQDTGWIKPQDQGLLIAHGLGGISGATYTNSKEAFIHNYALGKRWFEVDLFLLKDGNLVCYHDHFDEHLGLTPGKVKALNTQEFLQLKFDGQYTLLSFEDFLRIFQKKNDAYLVTDTKGWSQQKIDAFLRHVQNVDPQLISRIIPQIYEPEDMKYVKQAQESVGHFASIIFTLYMTQIPNTEVINFVTREAIPMVTIPAGGWRISANFLSALHQVDKYTFVHTVNEAKAIEQWKALGVDGFYTDFYGAK